MSETTVPRWRARLSRGLERRQLHHPAGVHPLLDPDLGRHLPRPRLLCLQDVEKRRQSPPPQVVAGVGELRVGQVKLFRYPTENDPAILIRLDEDRFVAYQQRCTHLSCPVMYSRERGRLECPCHNGAFDAASGQVLEGPPPRALPQIDLLVHQGQILAEGVRPS